MVIEFHVTCHKKRNLSPVLNSIDVVARRLLISLIGAESDIDSKDKTLFYVSIVSSEHLEHFKYCHSHSSLSGNVLVPFLSM